MEIPVVTVKPAAALSRGGRLATLWARGTVPTFRTEVLRRSGLDDELSRSALGPGSSAPGPVALVCAPAGAGKTMLIADWARAVGDRDDAPVLAWLTVGEPDNELTAFWTELLAALLSGAESSSADTGLAASLRALAAPTVADFPEFAVALCRSLEQCGRRVCVVLDDAHVLHDPTTSASLDEFLRWSPPGVSVIVSTRFEIALSWQRLAIEGRLTRVGMEALAFNAAEMEQVLAGHGIHLEDRADLAALAGVTGGWPAAIRLAAIHLSASGDTHRAIASFVASPRPTYDYLVDEIIAGLRPDLREFVVLTAVADVFTAGLADALCGGVDGAGMIEELARENFLLTREEGPHERFRYHPLMLNYLRGELRREHGSRLPALHATAVSWLSEHGFALDALALSIRAEDGAQAFSVVAAQGLALVLEGRGQALFAQLDGFAFPQADQAAYVQILRATLALERDDSATAATIVEDQRCAQALVGAGVDLRDAVRLGLAARDVDEEAIRAAARALPGGGEVLDSYVAANLGLAESLIGGGGAALALARIRAADHDLPVLVLRCMAGKAINAAYVGGLHDATAPARAALDFARAHVLETTGDALAVEVMLAWFAYLQADAPAEDRADLRGRLRARGVAQSAAGHAQLVIAGLSEFDRTPNPHGCVRAIAANLARALDDGGAPLVVALLLPHAVWACLRVGERAWATQLTRDGRAGLGDVDEVTLSAALLEAHGGRMDAALELVSPVLARADAEPYRRCTAVQMRLVEAAAHSQLGRSQEAHRAYLEAMSLAEADRLLRPFVMAEAALRTYIDTNLGRFAHQEAFAARIRERLRGQARTLEAPLTDAESEILRELPSPRSAAQIAEVRSVSVNTVKSHLRGIYRKLGVRSRGDAVMAARRIGLL